MGKAMLAQDFVHSLAKRTHAAIAHCSSTNAGSFASARRVQVRNVNDRHRPWLETAGAIVFPKNFGSLSEPAPGAEQAQGEQANADKRARQRTGLYSTSCPVALPTCRLICKCRTQTRQTSSCGCDGPQRKRIRGRFPNFYAKDLKKIFTFFPHPAFYCLSEDDRESRSAIPIGQGSLIRVIPRGRGVAGSQPSGRTSRLESTRSASEGRKCLGEFQTQIGGQKKRLRVTFPQPFDLMI